MKVKDRLMEQGIDPDRADFKQILAAFDWGRTRARQGLHWLGLLGIPFLIGAGLHFLEAWISWPLAFTLSSIWLGLSDD
jgi:hypothetical protein